MVRKHIRCSRYHVSRPRTYTYEIIAFDSGLNVTLGLPIIRTSVDHQTAFDITSQVKESEKSLINALKVSTRLTI